MILIDKKTVELLAPAGTWEAFVAAIDAGADAVYIGGKHFNMRVHRNDFNFDDDALRRAVQYAHERNVKLYITLNNLISEEELPALEEYLRFLGEIQPDAILVQDFAVVKYVRELGIPMHASIMMNTHNAPAIEMLKTFGITRVVISREFSLAECSIIKQQTGVEIEYFVHGDMCISESGQCIHSGVAFGQSGNRGRCLKPCRWQFQLIDEINGEVLDDFSYKLALKDMCMYRNLPELINAGVNSFKIEGRMRPPEFIHRIVSIYRRAIDRYFDDPSGFSIDDDDWQNLFDNRARDFTTSFALSRPTIKDIGTTGEREPRFFSKAIAEPTVNDPTTREIFASERPIKRSEMPPRLSVRVSTIEQLTSAIESGADAIYLGGEVFKPLKPITIEQFRKAIEYAHSRDRKLIVNTPRATYRRELHDLDALLSAIENANGVMVSNLGALSIAKKFNLPIQTDLSFNLFNHEAARLLQTLGASTGAASLELSFSQLRSLVEESSLPIEVLVHGSFESMICDHNFAEMSLGFNGLDDPARSCRQYALKDEAGEIHSQRIDQYGRAHLYFGRDLCLLPYLDKFMGAASLRIDAQLYSPKQTARVVSMYRRAIDGQEVSIAELQCEGERPLGVGVYRFRQSKNS